MPVGAIDFLARRHNFRAAFAATLTVLIAFTLSIAIEMTQLFDDARKCSASEVVCNVSGTIFGVALSYFYQNWLKGFVVRAERAKLLLRPVRSCSFTPGLDIRHFLYSRC